jgi:hypothetical protein
MGGAAGDVCFKLRNVGVFDNMLRMGEQPGAVFANGVF